MLNKSIFITGATGKVGRAVIKSLLPKGYKLTLICRKKDDRLNLPDISVIEGDLLDASSYISGLKGSDTILHMAAVTHTNDIKKYYRINSDATLELIKACKANGVKRFIHISTRAISVDGGHYSRSKSIAEKYVRESGLNWVIQRLSEIYGLSGDEGIDMLLKNIHRFPVIPVIGNGKYTLAPIHASDAIAMIIRAIEDTRTNDKLYNIAGPKSFSYVELIDIILRLKHVKRMKLYIPLPVFNILARAAIFFTKDRFLSLDQLTRLLCDKSDDIALARSELCFKPHSFEEMIGGGDHE